jgi:hypothetical protein
MFTGSVAALCEHQQHVNLLNIDGGHRPPLQQKQLAASLSTDDQSCYSAYGQTGSFPGRTAI